MPATQSSSLSPRSQPLRDARVVVTGASGFIGRHLCAALTHQAAELVVLQSSEPRPAAWPHARAVTLRAADRTAVDNELKRIKPDFLFHLAGFVTGDRSTQAMTRAFDGNVLVTANLLLACLSNLPETRVITTTSLEASNPLQCPSQSGSPYGISKLMVEVLSGSLHGQYGAPMFVARLGMVYGPDDPNTARVVPSIIGAFLQHQRPRLSSGQRRSDWIYVDDVVRGLLLMATARELRVPALDLGTGELYSVRAVAETIADIMGAQQPIDFDPNLDRPREQERRADVRATQRALELGPLTPLRAGLAQTVAWYAQRALGPAGHRRGNLTPPSPECRARR